VEDCSRMEVATTERTSESRLRLPYGRRLFATLVEEPRARRVTDLIVVVAATSTTLALGLVAVPTSGAERWVADRVTVVPSADAARGLAIGVLVAWAAFLVIASGVKGRLSLVRDLALAALGSVTLAAGATWLAHGTWTTGLFGSGAGPAVWVPPLTLAVPAALVLTASPQLSRPARQLGRWLIALTVLALATDTRFPTAVATAWLVAVVAAGAVHLALGSSRGRPSLADVQVALARLGVGARTVDAAERQDAGVFVVNAVADDGRPLVVKVYGRDAKDTRLVAGAWRRIWYRESGAPVSLGRLQQVEHEAFLTLFVAGAGVLTHEVVAAGSTPQRDAVLALRPRGVLLGDAPEAWSDETAEGLWSMVHRLHHAGVAHGRLDDAHLIEEDGHVGLADLRGASIAADPDDLRRDEAQALVTTALALGADRALTVARRSLGDDRLAQTLAFVQAPALTPAQRVAVQAQSLDLDELRGSAARLAGVEVPDLQQLRRVTWGSALQVVLLVLAVWFLASQVAGLDLGALWHELREATWWLVLVGAVVAQTPRFAQAVSCLGASPRPLPLKPVYFLQLALTYIGIAVPSSAARIAVNVRFFQRQGLTAGSALAVGALDGFSGFIVEMVLLVGFLVLTPQSLHFDLSAPSGSGWRTVLLVLVGVAVVVAVVAALNPRRRNQAITWARGLIADGFETVRGLRSPRRLSLLIGGNLASDLLFAATLGLFAMAFGTRVPFPDLVVIIISVSLLAGLLPIPGGVGVAEGALTLGLVGAGMPEEPAFAAVLTYRLATFYIPPTWGFLALRWLERNKQL